MSATLYDKHFILTADIDLDPNLPGRKVFDRAVIAPDTNDAEDWHRHQGTPFTGVFDGNQHTISHLSIAGDSYLGLFGQVTSGSEIKNVGVIGVNITGSGYYVGALAGYSEAAVTACYSTGAISSISTWLSSRWFGGLLGHDRGHVINCYSRSRVSGDSAVGGLVGWLHHRLCYPVLQYRSGHRHWVRGWRLGWDIRVVPRRLTHNPARDCSEMFLGCRYLRSIHQSWRYRFGHN